MPQDTEKLYDSQSNNWVRERPLSLSDFTARPFVFDLCGEVKDLKLLDLGAGEGYCARRMAQRGANVTGVELSSEMVKRAREQEVLNPQNIDYKIGDVTKLEFADKSFDLAMGVFVYNYLTIEQTQSSFNEVFRVLRDDAYFVFSVPHPSFPFIDQKMAYPFYFDFDERGYFSSRDIQHQGKIWRLDGCELHVQMIHKTLEDYFDMLSIAGFNFLPTIKELRVMPDMLEDHPEFFGPLLDIPLHLAFKIKKQ